VVVEVDNTAVVVVDSMVVLECTLFVDDNNVRPFFLLFFIYLT